MFFFFFILIFLEKFTFPSTMEHKGLEGRFRWRDTTRHVFSRSLDSLRVSVTRVHKSSLPWQRSIARGNGVFAPSVKPILGIKIYDNQGWRGENLIRPRTKEGVCCLFRNRVSRWPATIRLSGLPRDKNGIDHAFERLFFFSLLFSFLFHFSSTDILIIYPN